ncbi:hypothetical protein IAT40_007329 [Kwoniella sp. CBS 6097]
MATLPYRDAPNVELLLQWSAFGSTSNITKDPSFLEVSGDELDAFITMDVMFFTIVSPLPPSMSSAMEISRAQGPSDAETTTSPTITKGQVLRDFHMLDLALKLIGMTPRDIGTEVQYQPVLQIADSLVPTSVTRTNRQTWLNGQGNRLASDYRKFSMQSASVGGVVEPSLSCLQKQARDSICDSYQAEGPTNNLLQAARRDFVSHFQSLPVQDAEAVHDEVNRRANVAAGIPDLSTRKTFAPSAEASSQAEVTIDCRPMAKHLSEAVQTVDSQIAEEKHQASDMREANSKLPKNLEQWVRSKLGLIPEELVQNFRNSQMERDARASSVGDALSEIISTEGDGNTVPADTDFTSAFHRLHSDLSKRSQVPGYHTNATADLSKVTLSVHKDPEGTTWNDIVPTSRDIGSVLASIKTAAAASV